MIVLGLATATTQVGCALGDDDGVIASFQLTRWQRHAESLAPAIEHLCHQSGISPAGLGAVALDVGPGLFTGLRVGVATGKALASALGIPMVGLSSLDLLAYPHRRYPGLVASVVDARRGEVFWALYSPGPGGLQRTTDFAVATPGDLASTLGALSGAGGEGGAAGPAVLAVGDGARRYAEVLRPLPSVEVGSAGESHPSPAVLVELALPLARRGEGVDPSQLAPLYLRQADVRINWAQRDRPPTTAVGLVREAG